MTTRTQITVRLDASLVNEMDAAVEAGTVTSRAGYVEAALRHERHRRAKEHELGVLAALHGEDAYPELAGMLDGFVYPDLDA